MKLLHTSDWHLGKRLENLSRLDEQKDVLKEICEIANSKIGECDICHQHYMQ